MHRIESEGGGNAWKIELRAYEIFDTPLTNPAIHFEIAFVKPSGEVFNVINGHPFDQKTGEITTGLDVIINDKLLKVIIGSENSFAKLLGASATNKFALWEGNTAEFYEKSFRGHEAGAIINKQEVPYIIAGLFNTGQNSGSSAFTIVKAMGLNWPAEAEKLWGPGTGRNLLPDDFQSYFDVFPVTPENFAEFLPRQSTDTRQGIHHFYTSRILNPLNVQGISRDIQERGSAFDSLAPTQFYDTQNAKTPDGFGVSATAEATLENAVKRTARDLQFTELTGIKLF